MIQCIAFELISLSCLRNGTGSRDFRGGKSPPNKASDIALDNPLVGTTLSATVSVDLLNKIPANSSASLANTLTTVNSSTISFDMFIPSINKTPTYAYGATLEFEMHKGAVTIFKHSLLSSISSGSYTFNLQVCFPSLTEGDNLEMDMLIARLTCSNITITGILKQSLLKNSLFGINATLENDPTNENQENILKINAITYS